MLGPDLSRVGSARSRQLLVRDVREASAVIAVGYQGVTLVTKSGERIRGIKKNEDAYSIQILDARQRLQGFKKSDLREVVVEKTSLMPDFPASRLNDTDLGDLVAYLSTLRGTTPLAAGPIGGGVTAQDLLDGFKNTGRWLHYSGDYTGTRHSPLTQITPQNVSKLSAQWTFQADTQIGRAHV